MIIIIELFQIKFSDLYVVNLYSNVQSYNLLHMHMLSISNIRRTKACSVYIMGSFKWLDHKDRLTWFRKQIYTQVTWLLFVTDKWLRAIDQGQYTRAVFLDLVKAFDTVDQYCVPN